MMVLLVHWGVLGTTWMPELDSWVQILTLLLLSCVALGK